MAQLTLTVADAHVSRILAAFGAVLDKDGNATSEEVRQFLIAKIRQVVRNYERQVIEADNVDVS